MIEAVVRAALRRRVLLALAACCAGALAMGLRTSPPAPGPAWISVPFDDAPGRCDHDFRLHHVAEIVDADAARYTLRFEGSTSTKELARDAGHTWQRGDRFVVRLYLCCGTVCPDHPGYEDHDIGALLPVARDDPDPLRRIR